jgi:hypothetical protein
MDADESTSLCNTPIAEQKGRLVVPEGMGVNRNTNQSSPGTTSPSTLYQAGYFLWIWRLRYCNEAGWKKYMSEHKKAIRVESGSGDPEEGTASEKNQEFGKGFGQTQDFCDETDSAFLIQAA